MFAGHHTLHVRLSLSAVDRGFELTRKVVVPRAEHETAAQTVLRLLAFCLFEAGPHDATAGGLVFLPGPADRDGPDLAARDLSDRVRAWVICGAPAVDDLRHVLQHQRQARVRILLGTHADADRLQGELRSLRRPLPGLERVDVRLVDEALIQTLTTREDERLRWTVTVLEGHVYVDTDGLLADGEVAPVSLPRAEDARA